MIQRIQTVYLLLAVVVGIIANSMEIATFGTDGLLGYRVFSLWLVDVNGARNMSTCAIFIIQLVSLTMALFTIFQYRNRKMQMVFCNALITLMVIWYLTVGAYFYYFSQDMAVTSVGWGLPLPLLELILFVMAKKRIKHDDDLVRAADRIR